MDKIENCRFRKCEPLGEDTISTCYCTHPDMHHKTGKSFLAVNCDKTTECHRFEPKPDEGRLLTEREKEMALGHLGLSLKEMDDALFISEAQDAKTASIKDAEYLKALLKKSNEYCDKIIALKEKMWAESDARIEALIEWLDEPCDIHRGYKHRRSCEGCWGDFKANHKEIKDGKACNISR